MKKFVLPYKITWTNVPGKGIYLRGRAIGPYGEHAMIVLVIDIITFLLWHPRFYIAFAAIGAALLFALPYLCRFNIEITRASVLVQTKIIGFVTREAQAPLEDVVVLHPDFVAANRALYSNYLKNKDRYLAFEFGRELYEPADAITVHANGSSFNLSGGQKEFGLELWDKLRPAIDEVAGKPEVVTPPLPPPAAPIVPAGTNAGQQLKEAEPANERAKQEQL